MNAGAAPTVNAGAAPTVNAGAAPTVIVAALAEEVRPLLARLSECEPLTGGRRRLGRARPWIARGRLAGQPVAVVVTGDGERNARLGVRRAITALNPSRLVAIGVAGGLAPDLEPTSLVVGARVRGEDGSEWLAEPRLVERAVTAGARPGIVRTTRQIVDSPAAKAALRASGSWNGGARTGPPGSGGPDVVDLESAFYAAEARDQGVPWVVVRAVSDAAHEFLPAWLGRCRDADGAVRRSAVLFRATLRPWTIPLLLRLRSRLRQSAVRLADAAQAAVGVPTADPQEAESGSTHEGAREPCS